MHNILLFYFGTVGLFYIMFFMLFLDLDMYLKKRRKGQYEFMKKKNGLVTFHLIEWRNVILCSLIPLINLLASVFIIYSGDEFIRSMECLLMRNAREAGYVRLQR